MMTQTAPNAKFVALAVTTALASTALSGCATTAAPRADLSASKAQTALAKGDTGKAVSLAENAVLADPQNASYRAMLGATYMEDGRFQSAATSFSDAMTLGDTSARTALSLALAQIASGDSASARALLNDHSDALDPADLGLALALAGDPDQGVHILSDAIRGGQNTPKMRQNLAYAYALQGDWRRARLMAAEDVPANQVNDRIASWAQMTAPGDFHRRVATLLNVPVTSDSGMPAQLALSNTPSGAQLAAEAAAQLPAASINANQAIAAVSNDELPALGSASAAPAPAFAQASTTRDYMAASVPTAVVPAPAEEPKRAPANFGQAFASDVVSQPAPTRVAAFVATPVQPKPAIWSTAKGGDHMIQLGSFSSEKGAHRAIGIYAKRYASISKYDMVISQARVNGKTYWRVAAGNMPRFDARNICSNVQARGFGCIAYAAAKPLPGAIDKGVRMAMR